MKTPFTTTFKYFLYARKSSESEDRQIQSIEDQVACLKTQAKSLGIEIVEVLTEAKSAKKPHIRPVFANMLARVEKGEASGILVWHLNRLSRNPVDSGSIGWMLQQGTLQCIQTMDRQYLPEDNVLLFSVESGMANQFIIELRKACMRGMDRKAELGWKPGMAPLGYVNHTDEYGHRTILPDPDRFPLVRKMWDLMLTGNYTPQAIRKLANEQWGFKTIRHKTKGGTQIPLWGIYTLFDNIFYTGMFRWKGKLLPGNHTPMITLAEYDKVQSFLKKRHNPRPQQNNFAFTGLIRCESCYMMFTATQKRKMVKTTGKHETYVYYHCSRKSTLLVCKNPPIAIADIEGQFEKEMERFTIAPEFLTWALSHIGQEKGKANIEAEQVKAGQIKALQKAEKELENLTRMRYQELIDDADFIKERLILKDQIARLQVQLGSSVDNSEKWDELTRRAFIFACYAKQNFLNGSTEDRRSIVSCFGSNYRIDDRKLLFDNAVWLIPIIKANKELHDELRRVELYKTLDTEAWNALLQPLILVMCTLVEEVRTAIRGLDNPDLYIPELKNSISENAKKSSS